MDIDYPEFTISETDDGVTVIAPDGEEVAKFAGSYTMNPAFLAFLEGVRQIPGASAWFENRACYLVHHGNLDASLHEEIDALLTPAKELRKRRP